MLHCTAPGGGSSQNTTCVVPPRVGPRGGTRWDQAPGYRQPFWILNLGQQDELQAHPLPWPARAQPALAGKDVSPPLLVGNWRPELSPPMATIGGWGGGGVAAAGLTGTYLRWTNLLPLITGSPSHSALWGQTAQPLPIDSGALPTGGEGPEKVPGHSKDLLTGPRRLALFC